MRYTIAQILILTALIALLLGVCVKPAMKISQSSFGDGWCDSFVMMATFFFSDETVVAEEIKNGNSIPYGLGLMAAILTVILAVVMGCIFGIPCLIKLYKKTKPKKDEESTTSGEAGSGADQIKGVDQGRIISFLKSISDGFDCDSDGHKYGNYCRSCQANDILRDMGIKTFHQEMIDDGTTEDFCDEKSDN